MPQIPSLQDVSISMSFSSSTSAMDFPAGTSNTSPVSSSTSNAVSEPGRCRCRRLEVFEMDRVLTDRGFRQSAHPIHETFGAAGVDVGGGRRVRQDLLEGRQLIVPRQAEVQVHVTAEIGTLQQVGERGLRPRPREVVQVELLSPPMQRERQTQHRGQPDPRRDEDVPIRTLGEREQSAGPADLQLAADPHTIV